jgi:hypothetical protein
METAPEEAGSVETDMGMLLPDSFVGAAPAGVGAHLREKRHTRRGWAAGE